jgi:hypothetical protein
VAVCACWKNVLASVGERGPLAVKESLVSLLLVPGRDAFPLVVLYPERDVFLAAIGVLPAPSLAVLDVFSSEFTEELNS